MAHSVVSENLYAFPIFLLIKQVAHFLFTTAHMFENNLFYGAGNWWSFSHGLSSAETLDV
jgi:hypothetical protein